MVIGLLMENQQIGWDLGRAEKGAQPESCLSEEGGPVGKERLLSGKSCFSLACIVFILHKCN